MTKKTYAVLGLGSYGFAVAKELVNNGAEVLAVDTDQAIVNSAISEIPFCKCADVTDAEVINQLGIGDIDVVIIAMANNFESSLMALTLCKEAGVKKVIVKCATKMHRNILSKLGADKVVFPEDDSGVRLAKNLLSSGFIDVIELSKDVSIIEMDVKSDWVGKTLVELSLRKNYAMNIVAIRKNGEIQINVDPNMKLDATMKLVVIMNKAGLNKFNSKM